MDDASGHYTPGLFYGNHYWIGSLSLCNTIYKAPSSITPIITTGNLEFASHFGEAHLLNGNKCFVFFSFNNKKNSIDQPKKAKDSISYNDFSPVETTQHENPPFLPGFFVLKAAINETVVARYVSDVLGVVAKLFIVQILIPKIHSSILATNDSNGSLFTSNVYIGWCWTHGHVITAPIANTPHWNYFGSVANRRSV